MSEYNRLSAKDIRNLGLRSMLYQMGFNFEKMQAPSFGWCILPGLEKIYGRNDPEVGKAIATYGMDFINTEPHVGGSFLLGLTLSMEENQADRELIRSMKTGLFGPLAGIGDAIFWFTLLPITGSIAASFSSQHLLLGPIFFFIFWFFVGGLSKILFLEAGYKLGNKAIAMLTENVESLTRAAGILGVMVVGAMIPNYISFTFSESFVLFNMVSVQAIFDAIMPNLLPALFTGLLYWFFKKKSFDIVKLILGVIIFSIIMAWLGIM